MEQQTAQAKEVKRARDKIMMSVSISSWFPSTTLAYIANPYCVHVHNARDFAQA